MTGAIVPDDWDGSTFKCLTIEWPASQLWEAILLGAISAPGSPFYWDKDSGDVDEAVLAMSDAYLSTIADRLEDCDEDEDCAMIGSMMFWGAETAPTNWMPCNGTLLSKTTYPDLFNAIGYLFGGSGDNFNIPLAGDRFLLHSQAVFFSHEVGDTGGEEFVTLEEEELPEHSHQQNNLTVYNAAGGNLLAGGSNSTFGGARDTDSVGSDVAHNNMPPFLVLNLIIKVL